MWKTIFINYLDCKIWINKLNIVFLFIICIISYTVTGKNVVIFRKYTLQIKYFYYKIILSLIKNNIRWCFLWKKQI